ncbi:MAG: Hint domain-containing protein, partial [Asticcacaulis sp.]
MSQHCFLAGTPILMADGRELPIEEIMVDDWVMAFDPEGEGGRGALVPARVKTLFRGLSSDLVCVNGHLWVTRGHLMLASDGVFRPLR